MRWLFYLGMPVLTYGASAICLDPNLFLWEQIQEILWCLSITIIHQQLAFYQIALFSNAKELHLATAYDTRPHE
jgi:hypothetical protein